MAPPRGPRQPPAAQNRAEATDDQQPHLGPYESRYDIVLGYGVERPIITS